MDYLIGLNSELKNQSAALIQRPANGSAMKFL